MAVNKIVLDLETQKSFDEVGGRDRNHLLKVSVCGIYSYAQDKFFCFDENQLYRAGEMISEADQVIGFNIINFDFPVLQPYISFSLKDIPTLDILAEAEKLIGHRVKLDNLAQTTLGMGKSGDGLEALKLYKAGRIEELKKYCTDDVKITKELYDYVGRYGKLLFKDYFEIKEIKISFPEPEVRKPLTRQAALF
ncbi:MAG: ribonuclease H-like domain-containing protein [Candidatus Doudnabacteria bacterium]|nr:ribonuclease H-like domain-containing protein [Candidatus Doudnabacteria bacterium]